jgi:hypothetical protein
VNMQLMDGWEMADWLLALGLTCLLQTRARGGNRPEAAYTWNLCELHLKPLVPHWKASETASNS